MTCSSWMWVLGLVLAYSPMCGAAAENGISPDLSKIKDEKTWNVINADVTAVLDDGKSVVHLKPKGKALTPSDIGLAIVAGLDFAEGTLEVDLKGQGKIERSFVGLAFSVVDGKTFEAVYFRPFNFLRDDKSFRLHGVQYIAWPDSTWEKLRQEKPGVYESAVNPIPDPSEWFHARIEVTKHKVKVWVDDAKTPCLVVDRLSGREQGKLGLFVDSREGAFRDLKILPAK
jgi:Domain of Unknown Function (DUF1080)